MSTRSIVRAHNRAEQRNRRRARRAAVGATAAVGAAFALAPSAQAATFQVTNLNDTGAGSLRDAVDQANLAAGADTVTFAAGLSGTITLTTGAIDIEEAIEITGPGAAALTVSGDDSSQIFDVETDEAVGAARDVVSISGLTLTDGDDSGGGAIYSLESDLRLSGMTIKNNYASSNGGAIDVEQSAVAITGSRITRNESGSEAGAIYTDGDNAAVDSGDTVTITDSVISNNYTAGNGGAFYFDNATGGDVLIAGSELSGNHAEGIGGAILFYGHKGSSTIRQSSITGNSSDDEGGGIYYDSDYDDRAGLLVENSTISGNRANGSGGGVYVENSSGIGSGEPVRFVSTTIADNNADGDGGGIYRSDYDVSLTNTVVADNGAQSSDQDDLGEAATATEQFTLGFSLAERFDAAATTIVESPAGSNLLGVDPILGPLGGNGGATETHLPADASPIVDAGTAAGLTIHQRGPARTVDRSTVPNRAGSDGTDMGSVELADVELVGADASAKKKQKVGKKVKVKVKAGAGEVVDVLASGKVKAGKKSYPLKDVAAEDVAAGTTTTLTLKPKKKKASKKIIKVLAGGKKKKAKATVDVTFTDAAGNADGDQVKVTLVAKKPKKK